MLFAQCEWFWDFSETVKEIRPGFTYQKTIPRTTGYGNSELR